jgi:hypothetical protein
MAQARPSGAAARVAGRRRRLRHRVRCADRASRTSYRGRPVAAGKIPGVSETRESEQESPPSTPALARLRPMSCGARGRRGRTTAMQRGAGACAPQTCPVQREVAGGAPQLCSAGHASAHHSYAARGGRLRTTDMSCAARGRRGRTTAMQRRVRLRTTSVQREVAAGAPHLCSAGRASAHHRYGAHVQLSVQLFRRLGAGRRRPRCPGPIVGA